MLLGTLAAALLGVGCGGPPAPPSAAGGPVHDGPVVLITLGSLRADAVGVLGGVPGADLTPNLDALAAEADWAGRAVAPSSWALPSLASLLTGLTPSLHGVTEVGRAELAPELHTLAEALADRGYRGSAYVSGLWVRGATGWGQGFAEMRAVRGAARAEGHLQSLGEDPANRRQLLWIHLPEPEAPYVRRPELEGRLPALPEALRRRLPERVTARELERHADPATPVPPGRLRVFTAFYRSNVAWADHRLGRLLGALRASGLWDDTLLVVTSPNGEELGEYGSTGSSTSLGRVLLEVPLVVKLPRALRSLPREAGDREPAGPRRAPVALIRAWSTVVEAVGGSVPPAAGPTLFRPAPGGVLSELHLKNGYNETSLVERDGGATWQLLLRSRFADPEPEYYPARLATYGDGSGALELTESPRAIFGRLAAAYERTPPLSGRGGDAVAAELLRWPDDGGVEVVDDPVRAAGMGERLRRRWLAFQGCERTPAEEAHRRRLRSAAAVPPPPSADTSPRPPSAGRR